MNSFENFSNLHNQKSPLVLGNVWDAHSALVFQKFNYKAIGTSSAAVANSLGYEDGEKISFSELLVFVKRILNCVNIPVSVDIEGGYGESMSEITTNIEKLYDLGIAGINIEYSLVINDRQILSIDEFSRKLDAIKNHLLKNNIKVFINARTDTFLLNIPSRLEETLKRIKAYEQAGANGIFVPCIVEKEEIKEIVQSTKLPVNVMCMPALPSFNELSELGVRRISMEILCIIK